MPGCGVVDVHAKWRVSHCETERRSVCQKVDNGIGKFFEFFCVYPLLYVNAA